MFGAVRNLVMPKEAHAPDSHRNAKEYLRQEKTELEARLKEIEAKLEETND